MEKTYRNLAGQECTESERYACMRIWKSMATELEVVGVMVVTTYTGRWTAPFQTTVWGMGRMVYRKLEILSAMSQKDAWVSHDVMVGHWMQKPRWIADGGAWL